MTNLEMGYELFIALLLILLTITVLVFFITSIITREQFEFIDYIQVTGMIFSFNILIYLLLGVFFSLFNYDPEQTPLIVGISYFILYFGLITGACFWVLRNSLMFIRTRWIVSLVYAAIYATLFTVFGGIL